MLIFCYSLWLLIDHKLLCKHSYSYPTHIFASSNGITFRVSTLFDNKITPTDDNFLFIGKIQDNADRI